MRITIVLQKRVGILLIGYGNAFVGFLSAKWQPTSFIYFIYSFILFIYTIFQEGDIFSLGGQSTIWPSVQMKKIHIT